MLASSLLAGVPHAFTGTGDGDHRPGVDPAAEERLRAFLGARGAVGVVNQVHGARVVRVEEAGLHVDADALVSVVPGRAVAVRVADCVPVLLAAPGGVAAIHAGWRGTAADIVRAGLAALLDATGARAGEVRAAVGPSICGACYEVGDEVIRAVAAVAPGEDWLDGRNVDLAAANASILRAEGVRVEELRRCTRCQPGYWSFRRDGAAGGRQVGAICP